MGAARFFARGRQSFGEIKMQSREPHDKELSQEADCPPGERLRTLRTKYSGGGQTLNFPRSRPCLAKPVSFSTLPSLPLHPSVSPTNGVPLRMGPHDGQHIISQIPQLATGIYTFSGSSLAVSTHETPPDPDEIPRMCSCLSFRVAVTSTSISTW